MTDTPVARTSTGQLSGEPAGAVFLGSIDKRCYLFLCQSSARMRIERENARQHGIQDPLDFVFEFDGVRYELTYAELRERLGQFNDIANLKRRIADLERQLGSRLTRSPRDGLTESGDLDD